MRCCDEAAAAGDNGLFRNRLSIVSDTAERLYLQ